MSLRVKALSVTIQMKATALYKWLKFVLYKVTSFSVSRASSVHLKMLLSTLMSALTYFNIVKETE